MRQEGRSPFARAITQNAVRTYEGFDVGRGKVCCYVVVRQDHGNDPMTTKAKGAVSSGVGWVMVHSNERGPCIMVR